MQSVTTRPLRQADLPAVSDLHARVFGPGRFARSAYRVREGKGLFSPFCRVAVSEGRVIAAIRLTPIVIGGQTGATLLGPIAVDPAFSGQGLGTRLIGECLDVLKSAGFSLVVLVGDEPYYGRFGFKAVAAGQIVLPGPVNWTRLLAYELKDGAAQSYRGVVCAEPNAAAGKG